MKKTRGFLFTAGIMLATAFTFSACSSDDPDDGGGGYTGPYGSVTDNSGNSYKTVVIGTQTWMAENLDYAAGDSKCSANCNRYGRLYDWETAMSACPSGWHLPSDREWQILVDFAGGDKVAGTKLKAKDGWRSYKGVPAGTDQYRFSALPGGYIDDHGDFNNTGDSGYWWSATEYDASSAYRWYIDYDIAGVGRRDEYKSNYYSVRCLRNNEPALPSSASTGEQSVFCRQNSGACLQISLSTCMELVTAGAAQIVSSCDEPPPPPSSSSQPPSSSSEAVLLGYCDYGPFVIQWDGEVTGGCYPMGTVDDVTNCTAWGQLVSSCPIYSSASVIIDSRDSKTYKTVAIGTQTWMAENLNYNVEGCSICPSNSFDCNTFGRLYDWATAMSLPSSCNSSTCSSQIEAKHRGICPSGWHLPSDAEWTVLTNYVGGSSTAGTNLKGRGTDQYGFSALLGGYGDSNGYFIDVDLGGYWWSSSEGVAGYAWGRNMDFYNEYVIRSSSGKYNYYSVRCLQD